MSAWWNTTCWDARMATTKKKAPKKAAKKLAPINLAAATLKSVKAAIGKAPGGGIINGFVLDLDQLAALDVTPAQLAKAITQDTARATGLTLKPLVIKRPGSILVGFMPPAKIDR
jgi:hypothetical protein